MTTAAETTGGAKEDPGEALVVEPPPPEGVPLPRGVRVVDVVDGREIRAAFRWKGVFAADPSDDDLLVRFETARMRDEAVTLAGLALARYHEDVKAAGFETQGFAFAAGFDYAVDDPESPWHVFVRVPSSDPHGPTPQPDAELADRHGPYFEILVAIPGG